MKISFGNYTYFNPNANDKKTEETLKSEIDSLIENNEILSGLNSAINNAKC